MHMHMPVSCQPSKIQPEDAPVASAEAERRRRERQVDDELAQSFPASDPPSWTMGITPADGDIPDDLAPGVPAAGTSRRDTH
jgi:hypothetical protein